MLGYLSQFRRLIRRNAATDRSGLVNLVKKNPSQTSNGGLLRVLKPISILLLTVLVGYFLWQRIYPSAMWRYRLTVTVEANGQTYSGSGVYEAAEWRVPRYLPEVRTRETGIRGEAIFIDLDGSNLVITLTSARRYRDASVGLSELSQKAFLTGNPKLDFTSLPALLNTKISIPPDWLPVLVTFENVEDPRSYRIVPPIGSPFFPGKVISASVEFTDDPVTTGIENELPFLSTMDRARPLGGDILPRPTNWISPSDFYAGTI